MTSRRGLTRAGRHQAGASAVEYAILVAGLAIALVAGAAALQATVRSAYTAAGVQIAAGPAPAASGGSTSAPATPSATPTTATPSATPTSATPSATPTSATPSATPTTATPSATPTPTRPAGSISVARGRPASDVEIDVPGGAKDVRGTTSPADQGTVTIDDGELVFTPKANATPGVVTVTWTYTKGGKTYDGGTVTYWVT